MESSSADVKQLIFFLIDKSGSMNSQFDGSLSRFGASMKLISSFIAKTQEMSVPSLFGSILFNTTIEIRNELTQNGDEFLKNLIVDGERPTGLTALFKAISEATNRLTKLSQQYPNATLRIIVFSDGEDNGSNVPEIAEITNSVIKSKVRVDSIFLCTEISKYLHNLSKLTGSSFNFPQSIKDGTEIISHHQFIDPSTREFGQFHSANVSASDISHLPEVTIQKFTKSDTHMTSSDAKQLVFFLVDRSGSMASNFGDNKNRYKGSMCIISSFVDQAENEKVSSLFGLITFNQNTEIRSELMRANDFKNKLDAINDMPSGGTALFTSIKKAVELLLAQNNCKDVVLRIVVFSDGNCGCQKKQIAEIINFVISNKVRVDSINLSNDISKELVFLSKATGGVSISQLSYEQGAEYLKKPGFVNPLKREFGVFHAADITEQELSRLPQLNPSDLIFDIKEKQ